MSTAVCPKVVFCGDCISIINTLFPKSAKFVPENNLSPKV